jgi:5'-AMP-activated protein kinase catalytic alpha subunit
VETQVHYAIKMFSREAVASPQLAASIKREIAVMKHVRHPNIVLLREVLASKTHIFIVLELVTGGELFDRIVTSGAPIRVTRVVLYLVRSRQRPLFRQA